MTKQNEDARLIALQEAIRVLRLIAEQGGDITEPWSAEMARRALSILGDVETGK